MYSHVGRTKSQDYGPKLQDRPKHDQLIDFMNKYLVVYFLGELVLLSFFEFCDGLGHLMFSRCGAFDFVFIRPSDVRRPRKAFVSNFPRHSNVVFLSNTVQLSIRRVELKLLHDP